MVSPFPHGAQVVLYARDSGGTGQDLSVHQQQRSVGEWCKDNGLILTREFIDVAKSGTRADRTEFQAMVKHFSNGATEAGLVVWEYARISRDLDDLQYYVADLRRAGYIVHSLTDNIPPGLDGRLLESIIAWKNAKYIQDLRTNVTRGLRYCTTVYHAYYGNVPVGYRLRKVEVGKRRDGTGRVVNQLELDPDTAPLVRRAFEMRAGGATLAEIDDQVNIARWKASYSTIFHNQIYLGRRVYGDAVIEGYCPAIIDQATWDQVQRTNAAHDYRRGGTHPRQLRSRFILSGLLYCGQCGARMGSRVAPNVKRSYDYYICMSYWERKLSEHKCTARLIPKDEIEKRVLARVKEYVLQPETFQEIYTEVLRQNEEGDSEADRMRERLEKELAEVSGKLNRVVSAIRDVGHSAALLQELQGLEARQLAVQEQLAALRTIQPLDTGLDMGELVEAIREGIDTAPLEEQGGILRGFVTKIVAEKKGRNLTGEITYTIPVAGADDIEYIVQL